MILTNEKYIGDALLQKTVTYDLLEKKRKKNINDAPQYYVFENHEAIIPKEIFYRVQEEMARRANLLGEGNKKRVYSGRYALTGVIYCGVCGDVYRRIVWNIHGRKQPVDEKNEILSEKMKDESKQKRRESMLKELFIQQIQKKLKNLFSAQDFDDGMA